MSRTSRAPRNFESIQWLAHFPRWGYRIPGPPPWLILILFIAFVLLAFAIRMGQLQHRRLSWGIGAVWLTCAKVIAVYPFHSVRAKGNLEVTVLDVGRGDSLFIVSPSGKTMLIEAGERSASFRSENNIVEAIRARKRFRRFCGRGDFKHWMRILRTDRDGGVHILTDGTPVEISCFVACPDPRSASGSVQAQAPNHEQSDEKQ
jgi:hypothetical protein